MHKTATINTRIDPTLKKEAEGILSRIGLSAAEAIRLFYSQIKIQKGLPFTLKIPNRETLRAMKDADEGKTSRIENLDRLFAELKDK